MPRAVIASPAAITRTQPMRPITAPASGPAKNEPSEIGSTKAPASSGLLPATSCSRWLSTSSKPIRVMDATSATSMPVAIGAWASRRKSISGRSSRSCRRTKTPSVAPPSTSMPRASTALPPGLASSLMP